MSGPVIGLLGLFGVGNLGNEASLRAILDAIDRHAPGAEIHCICRSPDRVTKEHRIVTHDLKAVGPLNGLRSRSRVARVLMKPVVEVARFAHAYRLLRKIDILILPGTGVLDDFGEPPSHLPLDVFTWSVLTRVTRTRLVYIAVGAGPIHNRTSRWLMKRGLGAADDVSFRDDVSKRFMSSIGRDTRDDRIVPDLAFWLPVGASLRSRSPDRMVIGLGVMAYYGWSNDASKGPDIYETYLAKLVELTIGLLRRSHAVRILVGEGGDSRMVDDLLGRVAGQSDGALENCPVVASPITTFEDLLNEIGLTDLVVATRYHNVVAALMMHRPVVSLGYADKNLELVRPVGMEQYAQHVETFVVSTVLEHVDQLLARLPEFDDTLQRHDRRQRVELETELARVLTRDRATR